MHSFNPLQFPGSFDRPIYLSGKSAWIEHIPFAFALIEMLKPRVLVELGTHYGDSYCAFCQAIKQQRLESRAFAVDTWQGDEHAGFYGNQVLGQVRQAHDAEYSYFSRLVQATFDEAAANFGPDSIDLLHIDGLHSYEAVKHDFLTWKDKLSERAVVLFHDTNVRERDFGVWKLWEELSAQYPHFEFAHGHGLGVLAVGPQARTLIAPLVDADAEGRTRIAKFFAELGYRLTREQQLEAGMAAQQSQIGEVHNALNASEARNRELENRIRELDASIHDLDEALTGRQHEIEVVAQHAEEVIAEQRREMDEHDHELHDQVNALQAELDGANRRLHEIYSSRIWRLTFPWRALGHYSRTYRNRARKVLAAKEAMGGWDKLGHAAYRVLRTEGAGGLFRKARSFGNAAYATAAGFDPIALRTKAALEEIASRLAGPAAQTTEVVAGPRISILMPVYKVPVKLLKAAIDSVLAQNYADWELCIADDKSDDHEIASVLRAYANADRRIKVVFSEVNRGISHATNLALQQATGEFVGLLDNDDVLTNDALWAVARKLAEDPAIDVVYSDECKTDEAGRPVEIFTKPDWDPMLLLNCMYIGHFGVYRKSLVEAVGGFRSQFDFSQDYDLALRVTERARRVAHIERVLYGWRMIASSAAAGGKPHARVTNLAALQDAIDRRGWNGRAEALPTANRAHRDPAQFTQLVSVIVPSDNQANIEATIESLGESTYRNFETIIVTNSRIVEALRGKVDPTRVRFAPYDKPYNFSDKCNAGAKIATGAFFVFFNDDVRVISPDWIESTLEYLTLDRVGVVGPKLLYENGTIQHAGMVTGVRRLVGTAFHALPDDTAKHYQFAQSVRQVSLICGACLAIRADVFGAIGGFDAVDAPINHSDVDLCFKVREAGYECVYTPHAKLLHIGHMSIGAMEKAQKKAATRRKDKADIYLLRRWSAMLARDPYFTKAMRELLFHDSPDHYEVFAAERPYQGNGKDVLLVSHDLSESGAPRVVLEVAQSLKASGHFVVVVSPEDGPMRRAFQQLGITVIVDALVLRQHPSVLDFARNFDAVIANTAVSFPLVEQVAPVTDVYWYIHETSLVAQLSREHSGFDAAMKSAKAVWAGSQRAAEPLTALRPDVRVIEYGLDPLALPRASNGAGDDPVVISVFGSYEPRKGQDLMVEAIRLLKPERRAQCSFRFFGRVLHDSFFKVVHSRAKDIPQITLGKELGFESYVTELGESDLVVVPSRDDTLPLVSLHALSAGKPLMCTLSTGTSKYIEDMESGFIIPADSAEAIARTLESSLARRDSWNAIGHRGQQVFQQCFSRETFTNTIVAATGESLTPAP